MNKIKLSVALVTRNRPDSLKRTLSSLLHQTVKPYEVIISDDSNDVNSIKENKKLAKEFNCIYVSGPQKGLYANRNFVAKQCKGTHIRTMDDDHEFPEGHLEKCLVAILAEPDTIWTIGEYNSNVSERTLPSPIAGQLHPRGFSFVPKNMDEYYGISCGASVYPKIVIEKDILNCDLYKFGMMYLEYGSRLSSLNLKLKPLRSTFIIHNDVQSTASELDREFIQEARIFSMICLSFLNKPLLKNQIQTIGQILLDLVKNKITFKTLRRAIITYNYYIKN